MTHILPPDPLDPEAPGLDESTRFRRRQLAALAEMSPDELLALGVRAGILTPDGELAEYFRTPTPSPYRDALMGSALDFPILDLLCAREALSPNEIADELGQRWAVSENEIWGRLRRMAELRTALVEQQGVHFKVTDAGREAKR